MTPSRWGALAIVLCAIALLSACGGDDSEEGEPAAEETTTEEPAGLLDTEAGALQVTDVGTGKTYPLDCTKQDFDCQVATAGFQVLVVSFEPAEELAGGHNALNRAAQGVYVLDHTGDKAKQFVVSTTTTEKGEGEIKLEIAFTPRKSGQDFELYWPGNDPVALSEFE